MLVGVLLTQIGSPKSPSLYHVGKYLTEFLRDKRVIDKPYFLRELLVRGCIVPQRLFASRRAYKKIWLNEGSPLLVYSQRLVSELQQALGKHYVVSLGMRYQKPSIADALLLLQQAGIQKLVILPLFPQYASATTGSSCEEAMQRVARWEVIPDITSITTFATYEPFIHALAAKAKQYPLERYDKFLFSFHGLPENQVKKEHGMCYHTQCLQTAESLITTLRLDPAACIVSFQSRLGKAPWLRPYTQEVITQWAREGVKRLLVFTPSFVTDCLETIYEIGYEYAQEFYRHGRETLDRVESLNNDPEWVLALKNLIMERT